MEASTARQIDADDPDHATSFVPTVAGEEDDIWPLPSIDPYEVAYWRGGEIEVLRLWLFDLLQRGYLEVLETRKWLKTERRLVMARNGPPLETLSDPERELVEWFAVPRSGSDILTAPLPDSLMSACSDYRSRLLGSKLISYSRVPGPRRMWARAHQKVLAVVAGLVAGTIMLSFGAALFPVVIVSLIVFTMTRAVTGSFGMPSLTNSGKVHLNELRQYLTNLKDKPQPMVKDATDQVLLMEASVFGMSALQGTPYDAFAGALASANGLEWSVSLDSGGCGGCGGDGGCGGCGGCGCG